MGNISSKKTEQKAITKLNELIDNIDCADGHIQSNDKTISWDGTIDFYSGNIDKKDNYQFSVDIQVKGRTSPKKKLGDKAFFNLEVTDLKNYLKKDGTILILVEFLKDKDDFKIYYSSLLPYDIVKELTPIKDTNISKTKIKMREIKNSNHLEKICRDFQLNKNVQKRMNSEDLLKGIQEVNSGVVTKFNVWEKDLKNFAPESLVGTDQYVYTYNKDNQPVAVDYVKIFNMSKQVNAVIATLDKQISYDDLTYSKVIDDEFYKFGKAFSINPKKKTFNIKITGTLNERIKQLSFYKQIVIDKKFLIGEKEFILDNNIKDIKTFDELFIQYSEMKQLLLKHNIFKDVNLDLWEDNDFYNFNVWMNAIENHKKIKLKSKICLLGSKEIGDLKISIITMKDEEDNHIVESIWNNGNYDRFHFKLVNGDIEVYNNNIFLNLNDNAYLADDINFDEMKNVFKEYSFKDEEYNLLNLQVLEIIKAFDICNNEKLLEYADYLINILLEKDKNFYEIYYINYCQILKRMNRLNESNMFELIKIRDNTTNEEIKICCNLLLDNKIEANILIKKLNTDSLKILKSYPISKYL